MASAVQPSVANAFQNASDYMKNDLHNLKSSKNYYVSHELGNQMNHIEKGVNHMRLDSDFLNTSKEWGNRFDRDALNQEKADSTSHVRDGTNVLGQYKGSFAIPKVKKLEENQVREMHEWGNRNLDGVRKNIHPYAQSAQGRINQFSDYIGVTDRYTGYRNNLTRGSRDPTKLGMEWLKGAQKNPYAAAAPSHQGYKTAGQVFLPASLPKSRTNRDAAQISVDRLHSVHNNGLTSYKGPALNSLQERCGINTTFPGITEYMKRYNKKPAAEKLSAYNINPAPDFSIYDRPMAQVEWSQNSTEYQTRYEWPDCAKIVTKPWLRK